VEECKLTSQSKLSIGIRWGSVRGDRNDRGNRRSRRIRYSDGFPSRGRGSRLK
jgi:hypothetical protein